MSYKEVEADIAKWAADNQLIVNTAYRDQEVRSVQVVGPSGHRFQIWIDPPSPSGVSVHVWDLHRRRRDWSGPISQLTDFLNDALFVVREWSSANS